MGIPWNPRLLYDFQTVERRRRNAPGFSDVYRVICVGASWWFWNAKEKYGESHEYPSTHKAPMMGPPRSKPLHPDSDVPAKAQTILGRRLLGVGRDEFNIQSCLAF